jgi:hypothetical protein
VNTNRFGTTTSTFGSVGGNAFQSTTNRFGNTSTTTSSGAMPVLRLPGSSGLGFGGAAPAGLLIPLE